MKLTRFIKLFRAAAACVFIGTLATATTLYAETLDFTGSNAPLTDGQLLVAGSENRITISNTQGALYAAAGGYQAAQGRPETPHADAVQGNLLTMTGGILRKGGVDGSPADGYAYGALSYDWGKVQGNAVSVMGGSVVGLIGGYGHTEVSDNLAELDAALLSVERVIGGKVGHTDGSTSRLAANNQAIVSSASHVQSVIGAYYHEQQPGLATGNCVWVSNCGGIDEAYGAYVYDGDALNNTVDIEGARMDLNRAFGARVKTGSGQLEGNQLNLKGCMLNGAGDAYAGAYTQGNGEVTGNLVRLENVSSSADNTVYAGYSTGGGRAWNNRMELVSSKGYVFDLSRTELWGGTEKTGNRLHLRDFNGTVKSFTNFETVSFDFSQWAPGTREFTMAVLDTDSFKGQKIEVDFTLLPAGTVVSRQDAVIVRLPGVDMDEVQLVQVPVLTPEQQQSLLGEFVVRELPGGGFIIEWAGDAGGVAASNTLAFTDPLIATMSVLNSAGELVAGKGMEVASRSVAERALDEKRGLYRNRYKAFFTMDAGHHSANFGSNIDVDSVAMLAGVSTEMQLPNRRPLTLGAFVEAGMGSYNGSCRFDGNTTATSSGDVDYQGIGLLGRYELRQHLLGSWHLDASLRYGSTETDYSSSSLSAAFNRPVNCDMETDYMGAHLGTTYTRALYYDLTMVAYGQFIWTHFDGATGYSGTDRIVFDDVDSRRLRVGARFTKRLSYKWHPFAGLACDWEFSGNARAQMEGGAGGSQSAKGATYVGELGVIYCPDTVRPMLIEGSLYASSGEWEGYGAKAGVIIAF